MKRRRKFTIKREQKRKAEARLDLPIPLNATVLKITSKTVGAYIWEPALEIGRFTLADYFEVGKTVFPITQRGEANKALTHEKERINDHNKRLKESIDFEDAFRRKIRKK